MLQKVPERSRLLDKIHRNTVRLMFAVSAGAFAGISYILFKYYVVYRPILLDQVAIKAAIENEKEKELQN